MTAVQVLTLLGVPALAAAAAKAMLCEIRRQRKDTEAVKAGMQALLRAQMIGDYNRYLAQGWAPIYARENFENCWQQYHRLGANGVMDDLRTKFLALPTK